MPFDCIEAIDIVFFMIILANDNKNSMLAYRKTATTFLLYETTQNTNPFLTSASPAFDDGSMYVSYSSANQ